MTPAELIGLTAELIEAPSAPEHEEHDVAIRIADILQREGIRVWIDHSAEGRPNVLALIEGEAGGKTLLFNGHTDVVPAGDGWTKDPWKARQENGRLYGRGACDMKGGLAAMMAAAIRLQRMNCPFRGRLALLFNADEERSNIGIKHFIKNPLYADYVIVGEPTALRPCIGHRGNGRIRISTAGEAGHCAVVERPDNALYKLARIITALENHAKTVRNRTSEVGNGSLTVTMAGSGSAPNIVPDHAWLELDRRILPGETKESMLEEIQMWAEQAAGEKIAPDCYLYFPAHSIHKDHPLVNAACSSVRQVTGHTVIPQLFSASTEAPFFSVDLGYPTLILGPGSLEQAHRPDEFLQIEQLVQASEIYQNMVMTLLER